MSRFHDHTQLPIILAEFPSSQSGQRRSSRTGKGNGGQLQQLQNIERIQTAVHARSSNRNLENATQGHPINPMAPSHQSDKDPERQVTPWAGHSDALAESLQSQLHGPSFTLSQPGDRFGFSLPPTSLGNTSSTIQSTWVSSSAQMQTR